MTLTNKKKSTVVGTNAYTFYVYLSKFSSHKIIAR